MKFSRATFSVSLPAAILIFAASPALAQTAPDEHQQHHPQQQMSPMPSPDANTNSNANANSNSNSNASGGMTGGMSNGGTGNGMSGGMGEMMKQMQTPPQKELYPSLINLPQDLSAEKRDEIKKLADARVSEGNALISSGAEKLKNAAQNQDFTAMREANAQIRQGQILLESGLAAQKALAENQNPQDVSFRWFKREMNLAPAVEAGQPHGFFGLSWFHYVTMLTLAAFAAAMIWMYFRKMKRADALVARLAGAGENVELPAVSASLSPNIEPLPVNPEIAPTKSNSWTGNLRVSEIFDETPQVKTFRLTDPSGGRLPFNYLPGQFATVTIEEDGKKIKRSYTIASSPTRRDYCELTVKREPHGAVSRRLHDQIREDDSLQITAPSGKFTFTGDEAASIVLVAGGVGVTPLMSAVRYLTDRAWTGEIFFFFACRSEKDIIFREEIEFLAKRHPNLRVWIILEESPLETPENPYLTGRITKEILNERVPEIASRRVHICGPAPMMEAVEKMLAELGTPEENIFTEIFIGKQTAPKPASAGGEAAATAIVNFARSKKTAVLPPDKTILEASEDVGVNIDYSCRAGICGLCKTRRLSGAVKMEVDDALTDEDKAQNVVLACQAKATTEDISVDA